MTRIKKTGKKKPPKSEHSHTGTGKDTATLMLNRIKHRNELLQHSCRRVHDLTSFQEIDLSAFSIQTASATTTAEESDHELEADFSVGFFGYDSSYPVGKIKVDNSWLLNNEILRQRILSYTVGTFGKFGVYGYSRFYGCEVQYSQRYTSLQGSVEPGDFAVIDTVEAFGAWISQQSGKFPWMRSITVRFVQKDGTRFDPSFRTQKEAIAERNLRQSLSEEDAFENMSMTETAEPIRRALSSTKTNNAQVKRPKRVRSKQVEAMLKGRAESGVLSRRERTRLARDMSPSHLPSSTPTQPGLRALSLPEIDLRETFLALDKPSAMNSGQAQDTEMDDVL